MLEHDLLGLPVKLRCHSAPHINVLRASQELLTPYTRSDVNPFSLFLESGFFCVKGSLSTFVPLYKEKLM